MLHIHRSERADGLVAALGSLVIEPLDDPMAAELVAVPTRGIERWLAQRLSTRLGVTADRTDGICANIRFPFPSRLIGAAVAAASGVDLDDDPWLPERAVWPLLDVVDECLAEPWLASLAAHVATPEAVRGASPRRRFTSVRHLADLYDHYGVHRPTLIRAWASSTPGCANDADEVWQAELWRRLRARIACLSPAERLEDACARLRVDPAVVDLPARVSLFGLTRLPASYLEVLDALAVHRQVHLFLLHPSPVLWQRVAAATEGHPPTRRRRLDTTATLARHPLLESWGRDAREMQLVIDGGEGGGPDDHRAVAPSTSTILRRLQAEIRADQAPPGPPLPGHDDRRPRLERGDRSLQVHACHGRARQVEVLRDAILHLLNEDATLEARDVVVMCPDIEAFAPLIHATFETADETADETDGYDDDPVNPTSGDPDSRESQDLDSREWQDPDSREWQDPDRTGRPDPPPPGLRVRLADRSLRQTNPVLGVVAELVELASSRLTATQVLDLAGAEPVRRRFRFGDDDLARIGEWIAETGVRWGLDAAHRSPFRLQSVDANTWHAGLDRVLLGVAMADEDQRLVGGALPLDDVDSGAIDLAGRFAEFIDRLQSTLDSMVEPKMVGHWVQAIVAGADALTATTGTDTWQRAQLQRILDDVVSEASTHGEINGASLDLPEMRALLSDRLRGQPTRANFRTGHLTICTLLPMRSVPHRVVCLLGLDDGVFPRHRAPDGDDLLLHDPHVGDRDSRSEDRQLLLDALLAAEDHLIVTYTGRDERTNVECPPAVPLGELLDVVDQMARCGENGEDEIASPASAAVVVHHPLQPFDRRNFTVGAVVPERPWSFDAVTLEGARSLQRPRMSPAPFLSEALPVRGGPVELDQLVRFVQHPVRAFLRQRLGISVGDYSENVGDALPVQLDNLERWGVGQRLLDARLSGGAIDAAIAAEIARGGLPPGALADPVLDQVVPIVEELMAALAAVQSVELDQEDTPDARSVEVNLPLPDGRSLIGTVPGMRGRLLQSVVYSRVGPRHRLAAWVRILALTAASPERRPGAATIGRSRMGAKRGSRVTVGRLELPRGDPDTAHRWALEELGALIELYDCGLQEPLPLYCATSAAWAEATASGRQPAAAARAAWESTWNRANEDKELEHQLVLGGVRTFADVLCEVAGEPSRFEKYTHRLWDGLLSCEQLIDR